MSIWSKVASEWCIQNVIDREKINTTVEYQIDKVQSVIKESKGVPSALDAIYSDDDDDDDDFW
ncbi:hypothetical protein [[Bacillus] enclensis]|jgi:hypothetical protein|uniref:hypothetical protein n=1 Tax=[Bacillus] enclensis TaxID=1402860 RepID=UPI0018DD30A5|nr:hypothetical protein [[Bacillus] enclensis]MBH9966127.1 hypothetical protein [[Bacillus] enclensis]